MEITHLLPLFLLLLSLPLSSPSPFSPPDNFLLNCGSPHPSTLDNRIFLGDASEFGSKFLSFAPSSTIQQTPSPDSPPLYHTARIFPKQAKYAFEIKTQGTHFVRLHFSPQFDVSDALFHVSVNGYLLLTDFNGLEKGNSNGSNKNAFLKEYLVWAETGKLEILFTPAGEAKFGFVNAIEVFAAPDDLVGDAAVFVNNEGNKTIHGITHQGLQTVYRLNVGGPKVTPFNDTLWRTWIPDGGFLKSSGASKAIRFGGRIKYQDGGLSREVAPDNVYNSARVIGDAKELDLNITWSLPVSAGYKYLVRMHFCDIASMALYELYFNVYVNGNLAYENLDLSEKTQMLASPYYMDFVVDPDDSGVVNVSVSPSKSSSDQARINAILNALEVMRMNNSMGSLDGEVSMASILNTRAIDSPGIPLPMVVVSVLGAVIMIMYRKRSMVQDSLGWSRLPSDSSDTYSER